MSATPSPDVDQVVSQHQTLLGILNELERKPGLARELELVVELHGMLDEHFELEECPGGFFDQTLEDAPLAQVAVDKLIKEHTVIRGSSDLALRHMRACLNGPVKAVRDEVARLIADLRRHERDEASLLAESLYQDIGGGD